jgi:hypothetical protein
MGSSPPPTKPAKADASIRISVDACKPLGSADKTPKPPATASDAAKPQAPILPRSAASFAETKSAKKQEPSVLTMPRDEAWHRLLAYEVIVDQHPCACAHCVHAMCINDARTERLQTFAPPLHACSPWETPPCQRC